MEPASWRVRQSGRILQVEEKKKNSGAEDESKLECKPTTLQDLTTQIPSQDKGALLSAGTAARASQGPHTWALDEGWGIKVTGALRLECCNKAAARRSAKHSDLLFPPSTSSRRPDKSSNIQEREAFFWPRWIYGSPGHLLKTPQEVN